jgi:hypothetical protein
MMPNPPLPDDDPTATADRPDLGRRDDLERSLDERDGERSVPSEEERHETADEKHPEGLDERQAIEPDDATPSEDPGLSPI